MELNRFVETTFDPFGPEMMTEEAKLAPFSPINSV